MAATSWKYDDLETPKDDNEYRALAKTVLDDGLIFILSDGWRQFKRTKGMVLEQMEMENSNIVGVRVKYTMKGVNLNEVVNATWKPTFEDRSLFIDQLLAHDVVDEIDGNQVVRSLLIVTFSPYVLIAS